MTETTAAPRATDWLLLVVGSLGLLGGVAGVATMPDPQTTAHYAVGAGLVMTAVGLKRCWGERAHLVFAGIAGQAFIFIAIAKLWLPPTNVVSFLATAAVGILLLGYTVESVDAGEMGESADA